MRKFNVSCYYFIAALGVVVSFLMMTSTFAFARYSSWGCFGYAGFLLIMVIGSSLLAARFRFYRNYEVVFLMAMSFCVAMIAINLLDGLGRVCAGGWDACAAQKSIESGKLCSFHSSRYVYWYNWNILISCLGIVFGNSMHVAQVFNALSLPIALFPIYKLSFKISGPVGARFAAIAFTLNPVVVFYSTVLTSEYWAAACLAWSAYLMMQCWNNELRLPRTTFMCCVIFSGMMLGLSECLKSVTVILKIAVMSIIFLEFFRTLDWRRGLLRVACLAFICCVGSFVATTGNKCALTLGGGTAETRSTFRNGCIKEFILGLNVKNNGGYDQKLARKINRNDFDANLEILKVAISRDWDDYPLLMVNKFNNLHGSARGIGGPISEVNKAFQGRLPAFMINFADSSLVVFRIVFFISIGGLLFARQSTKWQERKLLPLVVILVFMILEQLIECHGRYKAAIYPFFFMVIPYASGWKVPARFIWERSRFLQKGCGWCRKFFALSVNE